MSRHLSYILRHDPAAGGITLDRNGWAATSDIVAMMRTKFGTFNHDMLREIVEQNDKQRFALVGTRIRANQGHSIEVDLALEPATPPPILYHGTKQSFMGSILREGLRPGNRQHVHLSPTRDTAEIVARRRTGESIILIIDTTAMTGPFFQSANGVWLVDHVSPEHFRWEDAE